VTREENRSSIPPRALGLLTLCCGELLAAPPPKGELRAQLEELAAREWPHPITGLPVRFGVSTLERWLHKARKENRDPVRVLRRKVRTDVGAQGSMSLESPTWADRAQLGSPAAI
jgi:hypothetical protein